MPCKGTNICGDTHSIEMTHSLTALLKAKKLRYVSCIKHERMHSLFRHASKIGWRSSLAIYISVFLVRIDELEIADPHVKLKTSNWQVLSWPSQVWRNASREGTCEVNDISPFLYQATWLVATSNNTSWKRKKKKGKWRLPNWNLKLKAWHNSMSRRHVSLGNNEDLPRINEITQTFTSGGTREMCVHKISLLSTTRQKQSDWKAPD